MFNKKNISAISAICAAGLAMPALAQDDDDNGLMLEEIIVTAQKREQSLQEVPVAVSAFSNEAIQEAEIRDVRDLQLLAPSLGVTQAASSYQTVVSIRGLGTSGFNPGLEPSVGIFVDGVYRSRTGSAIGDFLAVERIEVLRGPQSTLFGKNTSAGVISITTQKPTAETTAVGEVTVGDYGQTIVKGTVAGPVSEKLGYRLTANYNKRDGFLDNLFDGREVNDRDRSTVRGQLLWDISDTAEARLILDYSEIDEQCCAAPFFGYGPTTPAIGAIGGLVLPLDPYGRDIAFDGQLQTKQKDKGASLQVDVDMGFAKLTSISSWRDFQDDAEIDADFTSLDIVRVNGDFIDITARTQEFRLTSQSDGNFDWLAGMFFYDQDLRAVGKVPYGNAARPYFEALSGGFLSVLEGALGFPAGTFFAPGTGQVQEVFAQQSQSVAAFGQVDFHVSDAVTLTGGLRYTAEKKEAQVDFTVNDVFASLPLDLFGAGALAPLQIFPPLTDFADVRNENAWSGNLIASWDVNDDLNAYASFSKGYKAGGFNLARSAGSPGGSLQFEPEDAEAFEIGLKATLMNGRARANIALFDQTIDDFQANLFNGLGFDLNNAGSIDLRGVEFETQFAVTENFNFTFSGTYLDNTYGSFVNSPCPVADPRTVCDLSGETTGAPEWTIASSGRYESRLTDTLDWFLRGDVLYRGDRFAGGDLDPFTAVDATTEINMRVGIIGGDGAWSLTLWGTNITDEEYPQTMFDSVAQSGSFNGYPNDPRRWGVTYRMYY